MLSITEILAKFLFCKRVKNRSNICLCYLQGGGGGGGGGGGQHTAVKPSFSKVFNPGFKLRK